MLGRDPARRHVCFLFCNQRPTVAPPRRGESLLVPPCANENKHLARISTRRSRQQRASKQNCPRTHTQTGLHADTVVVRAANLSCNKRLSSCDIAPRHVGTQSCSEPDLIQRLSWNANKLRAQAITSIYSPSVLWLSARHHHRHTVARADQRAATTSRLSEGGSDGVRRKSHQTLKNTDCFCFRL